jgi:hypothetical protein
MSINNKKCSLCDTPFANLRTCPLNPDAMSPDISKHTNVQLLASKPVTDIQTIILKPKQEDIPELLAAVFASFGKTCNYDKTIKSEMIDDKASQVGYLALSRLLPDYMDNTNGLYVNYTDRVFIVAISAKGEIEGFLAGVLDVSPIINKPQLPSYDNIKYNLVYDQMEDDPVHVSWIEILCVSPSSRGKDLGDKLIKSFEQTCLKSWPKDGQPGFIGVDISGTAKKGINVSLKQYYTGLGYDFEMPTALDLNTSTQDGAQFGVKYFMLT